MEQSEERGLPKRCLDCDERREGEQLGLGPDAYCYNCDFALDRFPVIDPVELTNKLRAYHLRKLMEK